MKCFSSLMLFLFSVCSSYGQLLSVNSTLFVGSGANTWFQVNSIIATKDKGIAFTGETNCWGGGNVPSNPPDTNVASSKSNLFVGKLDSNMQLSWIKVYGGKWVDVGFNIVATHDGGYGVLGYTESFQGDVTGYHGSGDVWLLRLDSMGSLMWEKCYGSTFNDNPVTVAETRDHGLIFCGTSNGSGIDVPTHYSGSQFDEDWFLVKTDSAGNKQWAKSIGGRGDEYGRGTILEDNGGYYFISSSNSTDYDCADTAWHPLVHTLYDYYIFRLDLNGNILWDSSYGGSGGDVMYEGIWDERDSSIVINGLTGSNDYMVSGNHGNHNDMWVVKLDRNGVLKWQKCLGGTRDETGYSITTIPGGYAAYGDTNPDLNGGTDALIYILDSLGSEITFEEIGGLLDDSPEGSVLKYKDGFICGGTSSSQAGFYEGINTGLLPAPSAASYFCYISYFPLSINSLTKVNSQLSIYPNPSQGSVMIQPHSKGTLTISNSVGMKISTMTIANEMKLDIKDWPQGIYLLQWENENGSKQYAKLVHE